MKVWRDLWGDGTAGGVFVDFGGVSGGVQWKPAQQPAWVYVLVGALVGALVLLAFRK